MQNPLLRCLGAVLLASTSGPADASCEQVSDASERLACYDRLAECSVTTGADARLDCYDDVARGAERSPTADVIDDGPFQVQGENRSTEERRRMAARVVDFSTDREGHRTVELDNGQVWQELSRSRAAIENGTNVELREGLFGSVNMHVEGANGYIKVRRVR